MENDVITRRYLSKLLGFGALYPLFHNIALAQAARKRPDLIVANASWSTDNGAIWSVNPVVAGSNVLFRGTVQNIGAAGTSKTFRLAFRINGTTVSRVDKTGGLAAGATTVLVANAGPDGNAYWETSQAGSFSLLAVADSTNAVAESNENNNTLTRTIIVEEATGELVANDDTASTPKDTPVIIDVLANDTAPPGTTLFVSEVQSPTNMGGTVVITPDQKFVEYTPPAGFEGTDAFTYGITAS